MPRILLILQALGELGEKDPMRRECCLIFDGMYLMKKPDYNKKNDCYEGMVDYGKDLQLESNQECKEAKEALVFILVGLTGKTEHLHHIYCLSKYINKNL